MIKALIFDMDGLMFDTERLMKSGWEEASREMGFTLTEFHLSQMRGGTRDRSTELFRKWFHGTVDYDQGRAIRTRFLQNYIEEHGVPIKKGLMELLEYLKEQRIPAAVATSTARKEASRYWDMAGVTPYLQASVCGDEVKNGKPNPEIFLRAAEKLQISPEHCLVLEDSINGIHAAKAAGAISCMVPDLTPVTDQLRPYCDIVCEDLSQVIPYLQSGSFSPVP